jgi:hypothetical protein
MPWLEELLMETANIVCMKWGDKFGPEYVNNLYHMVKRNITLHHRFVCMTEVSEGIDKGVDIKPLPEFEEPPRELSPFCLNWRKLALFDEKVYDLKGKILFFDLDVVVVDNIDCFFSFSDKLAIIENWSQPNRLIGQSSVFCFEIGKYTHLLNKYRYQMEEVLKNNRTEQVYITRELGLGNFDYFPDEWCKSFKMHCMPGGILNSFLTPTKMPRNVKVIVFHGNPNPPDAMAGRWGKPVPWYKKFYKTVKPTLWIGEHWHSND